MIYGFDLETDHDNDSAWCVQWVLADKDGEVHGTDVRCLAHHFERICKRQGRDFAYAHNLHYDIQFLKDELFVMQQKGYLIRPIIRNNREICVQIYRRGESPEKKCKPGLELRDSLAKFPGTLRELGDTIGLPKLENTDPDFSPGWASKVDFDDPKEWEYVIRDATIVQRAMQEWHDLGFKRMTLSGDAWADARRVVNHKRWDALFPALDGLTDRILRKAYSGGLNYSKPGTHRHVTHEDKVSMYPGVMMYAELPIGKPIDMGGLEPSPEYGGIYIAEK